jgi:hypothetical protein
LSEFIKSYLHRVHTGELRDGQLEVVRICAPSDANSYRPKTIALADEMQGKYQRVVDAKVWATLRYRESLYDASLFWENEFVDAVTYFIYIGGLDSNAKEAGALLDYVIRQSLTNSPLSNGTFTASSKGDRDRYIRLTELEIKEESLDRIFLPDRMKRHLDFFVMALNDWPNKKRPLRYLLAGKPGTAKTKIIRALACHCRGKATFIFTTGSESKIAELFEIVGLFSPVVLCIDDVDLMTGSREEKLYTRELATFLQHLDGFTETNSFVLATTNNKRLVDLAASRPGRFDLVLDVGAIEPDQYAALIRSKTSNSAIVELFDKEVFRLMHAKKVSGAFIANLVKHLEIVTDYDPASLSGEYVVRMIEESHDGFYEDPAEERTRVGFDVPSNGDREWS